MTDNRDSVEVADRLIDKNLVPALVTALTVELRAVEGALRHPSLPSEYYDYADRAETVADVLERMIRRGVFDGRA